MKCLFCGTNTKVTNSRVRNYGVWRRRNCENAHVFTTTEQADLSELTVNKRGTTSEEFNTNKLALSLGKCGISNNEVTELQRTILTNVLKHIDDDSLAVESALIAEITYSTLNAYDPRYGNRYKSYSQQLGD